MEKKEDRRIQMTKRLLKDALISLLREKDIYHISIRELCDMADINRTTFYKYYGSQFDLLADMENDMVTFVTHTFEHQKADFDKIVSICRYLEENIAFARLIVNNNVDPTFAQKMFSLESIKNRALKKFVGQKSREELEYIYNFITYGAYRMVCVWLNKEERESPEVIARLLEQMMLRI